MKHRLIHHTIAGAAALLLLFGCQAEEDILTAGSKGIRIAPTLQTQAADVATRTVAGANSFSENDVIGISIVKGDETPAVGDANHPYKYASGVWKATGGELYWTDETSEHTLRAYYPYDEKAYAAAATTADFTLPLNEAGDIDMSADAYAVTDKAWGQVKATPTGDAVTIGMTHRMAQVIISLTAGEGVASVDDMTVELLAPTGGFAQVGTFNILDGSVSVATKQPDTKPQKMQMLKAADGKFYALVIPGQTFKTGEAFARIKDADGKPYLYNLAMDAAADLVTASNQPVHFTLTVATKAVSGMGVTGEEWGTPTEISPIPPVIREEEGWLIIENTAGELAGLLTNSIVTGSSLKKLRISGTVNAVDLGSNPGTAAGLNAFIATNSITDLDLSATVEGGTLASDILKGCTTLASVYIPAVTTIPANAFSGCTALKKVIMPDATTIQAGAFTGCTLDNLVISKLENISNAGFCPSGATATYPAGLFLTDVTTDGDLETYASYANSAESSKEVETYAFPKIYTNYTGSTVDDYCDASKYGRNWEPVVDEWLDGLTVITCDGGDLESKLSNLSDEQKKKVWIKGILNATDLGAYNGILAQASGLNKFIREYNITDLCLDADLLGSDQTVTTTLPKDLLKNCLSLVVVRLMHVTATNTWLFTGCTAIKTVVMPELTSIALNSFNGETTLETVILPKANIVGANAFKDCTSLKTLVLKDKGSLGGTVFDSVIMASVSLYLVSPLKATDNASLGTNYGEWNANGTKYNFNTIYGTYTANPKDYNAYLESANYKYSWTRQE